MKSAGMQGVEAKFNGGLKFDNYNIKNRKNVKMYPSGLFS